MKSSLHVVPVRDKSWILVRVDLDSGGDSELLNL